MALCWLWIIPITNTKRARPLCSVWSLVNYVLCIEWCSNEIFVRVYILQIAPMHHRNPHTFDLADKLVLQVNIRVPFDVIDEETPPLLILRGRSNLWVGIQILSSHLMWSTTLKLRPEFWSNVTDKGQSKGFLLWCIITNLNTNTSSIFRIGSPKYTTHQISYEA